MATNLYRSNVIKKKIAGGDKVIKYHTRQHSLWLGKVSPRTLLFLTNQSNSLIIIEVFLTIAG